MECKLVIYDLPDDSLYILRLDVKDEDYFDEFCSITLGYFNNYDEADTLRNKMLDAFVLQASSSERR